MFLNDKEALRRKCLEIRRALPLTQCRAWSSQIHTRLYALLPCEKSACLLTYMSSKDNEVDTFALIEEMLKRNCSILVPLTSSGLGDLSWSLLKDMNQLIRSRFGIFEPSANSRQIMHPPIDAPCLIPGIAFTAEGRRLGYGGGYYDRFLAAHKGLKIALAYEAQIVPTIPYEAHDVLMDFIVTEKQVYSVL